MQQGRTRDISGRGVFLVLRGAIKKDIDFDLTIELLTEAGVYVRAVVRAVRTEEWTEEGKRVVGVGATIRQREIVRMRPTTSSPRKTSTCGLPMG